MKKLLAVLLAVVMLMPNAVSVHAESSYSAADVATLQNLINEGNAITDYSSSDAYVWVTKVFNFNEKYTDSEVYSDIKSECESAKGYSSIATFNCANKIIGYLENLEDNLNGNGIKSVNDLIEDGKNIDDYASVDAYKWLVDVQKTIEQYQTSIVYSEIRNECNSAKGYSSVSTFNCANKIIGYLGNLEDDINETEVKSVCALIEDGKSIDDYASADAYKWLVDVLKTTEQYQSSFVYNDIRSECDSAKGYSSASTFNCVNKILGYLNIVQEELDGADERTVRELIAVGNALSDKASADAYKWVIGVLKTNENFPTSSVYADIKDKCNSAKGYSSISTFNVDSQILADLTLLYDEVPVSAELQGIRITKQPTKTVYREGELFSSAGMVVSATYLNTYEDNTTNTEEIVITNYTVDKTTPLSAQDNSITISFEDGGIIKTTQQGITVESYIVSTTLDSIEIASNPAKLTYTEGERFDKTGLSVNAKFLSKWSNGYEEYTTEKNVDFSVNTTSPLFVSNTSWTVSYIVDGVKKETAIPIVVTSKAEDNKGNGTATPQPDDNKGNDTATSQPDDNKGNDTAISQPDEVHIPAVSKVSSLKVTAEKKKLKISWKKDTSVAGYQLQISTKSNFKKAKMIQVAKSKRTYTKKGLKAKQTYFVRIRAYKTYKEGGETKKAYGKWAVKSKKVK